MACLTRWPLIKTIKTPNNTAMKIKKLLMTLLFFVIAFALIAYFVVKPLLAVALICAGAILLAYIVSLIFK